MSTMSIEERAYCSHLLVSPDRTPGYSHHPDVQRLRSNALLFDYLRPIFNGDPTVNATLRKVRNLCPEAPSQVLAYQYVQEQVYTPLWENMMKHMISGNNDVGAAYYDFLYGLSAPLDVLIGTLRVHFPTKIPLADMSWTQKYASNPDFETSFATLHSPTPIVTYNDAAMLLVEDPTGRKLMDHAMDILEVSEGCDMDLVHYGAELGMSVYSRILPHASELVVASS